MFMVVNLSESEWCCKATLEVPCRTQGFSHCDALFSSELWPSARLHIAAPFDLSDLWFSSSLGP